MMKANNSKNILKFPNIKRAKKANKAQQFKEEVKKLSNQLEQKVKIELEACRMAASSLLEALKQKDGYTFEHSTRVAYFTILIGREHGLNDQQLLELEFAALFHDVGKIGTPDAILKKPGRLNAEEFNEMKKHPEISGEIIGHFKPFNKLVKAVRHHHERFDGRGYPDGLKEEEIPLYSRMILVADTFDAMTSTRPYRKGLPHATAFAELMELAGTQFDPEVVKTFIRAMRREAKSTEEKFYLQILDKEYIKEAA